MKQNWKGFLCGVMVTLLLTGLIGTAAAKTGKATVSVDYNNIKVTLNGTKVNLVDATGIAVEPFVINGTTYLPVRAVASALGLDVGWDGATSTVKLTSKSAASTALPASSKNPTTNGTPYQITYQNCTLSAGFGSKSHYDAIVEVKNTGSVPLYLDDATFDFEDKSGHLLETKSFVSSDPNVIAPGERGYFYSSGSLDKIEEGDSFVFVPKLSLEAAKKSPVKYEVSDDEMTVTSKNSIQITGRVKNTSAEKDSLLWVCFVLYRADGTPITAGGTNLLNVAPGQKASFSRDFSLSSLGLTAADVASYQIFANQTYYQF